MLVTITEVVFPVFALIGLGYLLAITGIFSEQAGRTLGQYATSVAVPALLFTTLSKAELSGVSPWPIWLVYYPSLFFIMFSAGSVVRFGFKREARAGVIAGISAGFSNSALIGIPLITAAYGTQALVPLSLMISMHIPSVTVVSVLVMERAVVVDGYQVARPLPQLMLGVLKKLIGNPIVVAIVAGALWNASGLTMPNVFQNIIGPLGRTASPVALIAVGMGMVSYGIKGNINIGLVLSCFKIALLPATVFVMGYYVVGLPALYTAVLTMAAACPTGVMAFVFANQFGTGHGMSTNTITITTLISVVTASSWLVFLHAMLGL
ncbi:AEC family transporter [Polycladidibacter stylochi]|uniref:AEC family transporter n=1 Tax=Polycladidibacter stylochi TaxID=1807766 RepID=UPI00083432C9|nr:AEC family transporter [Pseudovibrio stylochi]